MVKNLSERIARISDKVLEKNIRLNSCLTFEEIVEFEKTYQIILPEDYRQFLVNIGNGGEGPPHYGLRPLTETIKDEDGNILRPDLNFPLTDFWIWEDDEVDWQATPPLFEYIFSHGHLYLGTDGCAIEWVLIITGSHRGKIWQLTDVGATPCDPARNFLSWYEYWLDGNEDF